MLPLHPFLHFKYGTTAVSDHEKAERFNSMFASKYRVPNPSVSVPVLPSHTQLLLDSASFAPEKVETFLAILKSDSAT